MNSAEHLRQANALALYARISITNPKTGHELEAINLVF